MKNVREIDWLLVMSLVVMAIATYLVSINRPQVDSVVMNTLWDGAAVCIGFLSAVLSYLVMAAGCCIWSNIKICVRCYPPRDKKGYTTLGELAGFDMQPRYLSEVMNIAGIKCTPHNCMDILNSRKQFLLKRISIKKIAKSDLCLAFWCLRTQSDGVVNKILVDLIEMSMNTCHHDPKRPDRKRCPDLEDCYRLIGRIRSAIGWGECNEEFGKIEKDAEVIANSEAPQYKKGFGMAMSSLCSLGVERGYDAYCYCFCAVNEWFCLAFTGDFSYNVYKKKKMKIIAKYC